jgi:hypothetical protein
MTNDSINVVRMTSNQSRTSSRINGSDTLFVSSKDVIMGDASEYSPLQKEEGMVARFAPASSNVAVIPTPFRSQRQREECLVGM